MNASSSCALRTSLCEKSDVRSPAFRRKFVFSANTKYELPPEGRTTNSYTGSDEVVSTKACRPPCHCNALYNPHGKLLGSASKRPFWRLDEATRRRKTVSAASWPILRKV